MQLPRVGDAPGRASRFAELVLTLVSSPDPNDPAEIADLRDRVARLAADAAKLAAETSEESARVRSVHDDEISVLTAARIDDRAHFDKALASRDLIGQAKRLLMAREQISSAAAFELLVNQSSIRTSN